MRYSLLIALLFCCLSATHAQFQGNVFVEDSSIKVYHGSAQQSIAWCGGFNVPQFTSGDVNNDGKPDIVVYETDAYDLIRVFINIGTITNPVYRYAPEYAAPFLATGMIVAYVKLVDYNRDGVPDLVTRGDGGFYVCRGRYVQNKLHFTNYKKLLYRAPSGQINAFAGGNDIPEVIDVDHDGDLDFFGYNEGGSILYFFKNCQVEHGLPNDSIEVCKPSNCWGRTFQGNNRAFYLGIHDTICNNFFTSPNYDCKMPNGGSRKGTMHGGNNICLLDLDGDGDFDLLDGNESFKDVQMLLNGKAQNGRIDSMVAQDTLWGSAGKQAVMPYFPAIFNLDMDGDGRKDLLITPHAQNLSENYKCVLFYKNMGSPTVPYFVYQSDSFFVDKSLDFGSSSYPVLYDYNKDGRPDLFVGSFGYYQSNGTFRSRIAYYENKLVNGMTRFELQAYDFNNIFSEGANGACPAFGDLDNDGKDDMVVGHADGTIFFYKNMAASNSVVPTYDLPVLLRNDTGTVINTTDNISPAIYDLNKDGKPDLLFTGNRSSVWYYENTGNVTTGVPQLHLVTARLGGMEADSAHPFSYGTLYIGKMDNTGKDYIVLGNANGTLTRYHGFQSGNVSIPYQRLDTAYGNIDIGARSAPAFGDIDGDGKYELLMGNVMGGLQQFRQVLNVDQNVGLGTIHHAGTCTIYPNPAADVIYLSWDQVFAGKEAVHMRLVNTTGQTVLKTAFPGTTGSAAWSVKALPTGIYICVLQAGDNVYTQRIQVQR